jgi:hypothetical protein
MTSVVNSGRTLPKFHEVTFESVGVDLALEGAAKRLVRAPDSESFCGLEKDDRLAPAKMMTRSERLWNRDLPLGIYC